MLTSTADASRNNENLIFKTDPATNTVDFLKFPVAGCDDDHGYDKEKECQKYDCPPGGPAVPKGDTGSQGPAGSIVAVDTGVVHGSSDGVTTFVPIKTGYTLAQTYIVLGFPTSGAQPATAIDSYIDVTGNQCFTSATQNSNDGPGNDELG